MKTKLATLILIIAATLSGCVSFYPATPSVATVKCKGQQCDDLFKRAQVWIVKNSAYRIQVTTDNILQTYGPHENSDRIAYTVTKEVNTKGEGAIVITGTCYATPYGCFYDSSVQTNWLHSALLAP